MKALAVGDLHLGKGEEYGRRPGDRLAEQGAVWARALELSREHDCDVVLFAGDAFETPRPSPQAMLAFERPLVAHRKAGGAPVIAILGNHDVASVSAGTGLEVFHEAGLLELAREPMLHAVAGAYVACLPWTPVSRLVAAQNGGDRDALHREAAEHLVAIARGLRGDVFREGVILLTHFSISGAVTPDGADVGLFREPVLDAGELEALGFDAVIAGHIHRPAALWPREPYFQSDPDLEPMNMHARGLYVGSPLPLSFGEAKCAHGCWVVDIEESSVRSTFLPIESRPFVEIDEYLSVHDADGLALVWHGAPVEGAVVKVKLHGTDEEVRRLVDVPAIKRALYDAGAEKVWSVQVDVERAQRARVEGLDEHLDDLQALDLYLAASGVNGSKAATLRDRLQAYVEEIPA